MTKCLTWEHSQDLEQIDFKVSDKNGKILITGECKDRKAAFGLELFRKCLKRIPKNSKVHLVLTNKLVGEFDFAPNESGNRDVASRKEFEKLVNSTTLTNFKDTDAKDADVNISDNLKSTAYFKLDCGGEKIQLLEVSIRGVPVLHAEQINRVVIFIELFPKPPKRRNKNLIG